MSKELQTDFGLNWADYGARIYDQAGGTWWGVDPLSEKRQVWSPYNYCGDNPIKNIDPDGRDWIITSSKGKDGKVHYNISFFGAVLNSSGNNSYSTKDLASKMQSQMFNILNVKGDGFVATAAIHLRGINKKSELRSYEHLIEFLKPNNFEIGSVGHADFYGKYIKLSSDIIYMMMKEATSPVHDKNREGDYNKKTASHEALHTAGLIHTYKDKYYYITRLSFDENMVKQSNENISKNLENDPTNVMGHGDRMFLQTITKLQIEIMYDNYINKNSVHDKNIYYWESAI